MRLRILFAIHGPPDPATAVFLNVSRRAAFLRDRGHVVDVLTPADFRAAGSARLRPLVMPVALAVRALGDYDVVIFHSYLAWAYEIRTWWRRAHRRKPATVVAFHGLEPLYHEAVAAELARTGERLSLRFALLHRIVLPRLLELACRHADRVFCLNTREKTFLQHHGWAEPSRVAIVPNGVDASLLQPRAYRARATRMLFTGQWLRPKGIRYLAAAFEELAASHPDVELTCAGTGADAATVLQGFGAAVRDRVRVLPRLDRDELARELARADIFMFPSLSEGFSGALLEAMAAALPVIATPAGAAPDLLIHDGNALLVPFADSTALAAAATRFIDDHALRRRLGAAAQEMARRYEWDRVNDMFAAEVVRLASSAA